MRYVIGQETGEGDMKFLHTGSGFTRVFTSCADALTFLDYNNMALEWKVYNLTKIVNGQKEIG